MKTQIIKSKHRLYYLSALQTISGRIVRDSVNTYIAEHGISMTELTVLNLLMDLKSLGFNEIANTLGVDAPFITELTNGLSEKRLINIERSSSDKRVKEASLSVDGFRLAKKLSTGLNKHFEKAFKEFSKEEIDIYIKILHSIILNLGGPEFKQMLTSTKDF